MNLRVNARNRLAGNGNNDCRNSLIDGWALKIALWWHRGSGLQAVNKEALQIR
jgi:hypothetical protein